MKKLLLISMMACCFFAVESAEAVPYRLVDLGTAPGHTESRALAISDNGFISGETYSPTEFRAFRWHDGVGMENLGTLPGGQYSGWALGVNNYGDVVGQSDTGPDTWPRATVFAGGSATDLGTLRSDNTGMSGAKGINYSGKIVGEAIDDNDDHHACYWGSSKIDLHPPYSSYNGFHSTANGINNAGQAVGTCGSTNGSRAFVWSNIGAGTTFAQPLGPLSGWNESAATRINEDGDSVSGNSHTVSGGGNQVTRAMLWQSPSPFVWNKVDLGTLGLDPESSAWDVNNSNYAVGWSGTYDEGDVNCSDTTKKAVVWYDEWSGPTDLNTLLYYAYPEWTLNVASSINNSGEIVGWGRYTPDGGGDPVWRAFLLEPIPEPATLSLLALGGLALLRRRR